MKARNLKAGDRILHTQFNIEFEITTVSKSTVNWFIELRQSGPQNQRTRIIKSTIKSFQKGLNSGRYKFLSHNTDIHFNKHTIGDC